MNLQVHRPVKGKKRWGRDKPHFINLLIGARVASQYLVKMVCTSMSYMDIVND